MVYLEYFLSYNFLQQALELYKPVSPLWAKLVLDSDSISCLASEGASLMAWLGVISFIKLFKAAPPRFQTLMTQHNGRIDIFS